MQVIFTLLFSENYIERVDMEGHVYCVWRVSLCASNGIPLKTIIIYSSSLFFFLCFAFFSSVYHLAGNINIIAIIFGAIFTVIIVVILISLICLSRHRARYYTHEEKRSGKFSLFSFLSSPHIGTPHKRYAISSQFNV